MNFNVLMENYDRVKELTEESAKSAGTADQKYEAYMDSMEAATKRLENAWESFTMKLESSKVLRYTSQWLATIVENMDKLVPLATTLLTTLNSSKIINFFAGSGGEKSGFANLFGTLTGRNWQMKMGENGVEYRANQKESWLSKIFNVEQEIAENTRTMANKSKNEQGVAWDGQSMSEYRKENRFSRFSFKNAKKYGLIKDPKTGAYIGVDPSVTGKGVINQKDLDFFNAQSALHKQQIAQGAMAGGVAVIGRLSQTKQVGSSGLAGLLNQTGQTIQEDAADKTVGVALTGIGAGVGAAFFGPIGGMIGQFIGDGLGGLFSYIRHRDELEMKQRVQEAKDRMSVLSNIKDVLKNNESLMSKDVFDTEDYEKLESYFDSLKQYMADYVEKGGSQKDFVRGVVEGVGYGSDADWSSVNDIYDLIGKLYNSTSDIRSNVQKQLQIQQSKEYLDNLKESYQGQLLERNDLLNKNIKLNSSKGRTVDLVNAGILFGGLGLLMEGVDENTSIFGSIENFGSSNYEETIKLVKNKIDEINKKDKKDTGDKENLKILQDYLKELEEGYNKEKEMEDQIAKATVAVGYESVDFSELTRRDINQLGIEGLVQRVANTIGEESRGTSGKIKSTYRNAIESAIKGDSRFSYLLKGDTLTLRELQSAKNKFDDSIGENETYDSIKEKMERGEIVGEDIEKLFYAADPTRIENFAKAWNMTTDSLEKFAEIYPNITQALGMMSTQEIKEYFSDFHNILDDLFEDATIDSANFEKILEKYPSLLNEIVESGEGVVSIVGSITDNMIAMENAAIANALYTSIKENNAFFDNFIKYQKEKNPNQIEDFLRVIGNSQNISQAIEAIVLSDDKNKETYLQMISKYLNQQFGLDYVDPKLKKAIEYKSKELSKQVDELQEQLSTLDKINDSHKKELELIKAKENLENAKKNKQRVYREGIGWTYEANEENISSAIDRLDDLQIEKDKESIQRDIDMLEVQRDILQNLDDNTYLEQISKKLPDLNTSISRLVTAYQNQKLEINFGTGKVSYTTMDENGNEIVQTVDIGGVENQDDVVKEKANIEVARANEIIKRYIEGENPTKEDYDAAINARSSIINKGYAEKDTKDNRYYAPSYNGNRTELVMDELDENKYKVAEAKNKLKKLNGWTIGYGKGMPRGKLSWYNIFDNGAIRDDKVRVEKVSDKNESAQYDEWFKQAGYTEGKSNSPDLYRVGSGSYYFHLGDSWYHIYAEDAPILNNLIQANANGTMSFPGGLSLINELGTEAIITPEGTLTSLPSKTGIVPADVTKNLWGLGEIAPTLVAQLKTMNDRDIKSNVGNNTYEEGQYIDNLVMNVYPTKDYDMDKLLAEARAKFRLTKHNN